MVALTNELQASKQAQPVSSRSTATYTLNNRNAYTTMPPHDTYLRRTQCISKDSTTVYLTMTYDTIWE